MAQIFKNGMFHIWNLNKIVPNPVHFFIKEDNLLILYTIKSNGVAKEKILDLLNFRIRLAKSLVSCSPAVKIKRGRPSDSSIAVNSNTPTTSKRSKCETRPASEVRYDLIEHIPDHDLKTERTRCKLTGCKNKSNFFCLKCKIHLCLTRERNCFKKFHSK